ncbi:sensor histidine kinase [Clostridium kluyveri]|uniref:HAMP domain-containing sensor histidine kinase n=1 Tax=Clostridium kluyveri TaxID=1534 RepID=UPI0022486069|nr:HAMP domain-containing sensor histidine kinase [Clostridium kluyveri]UZQ51931.1 HAMP domain-containing histidine kinase [Clostridium kluyveri]
MKVFKMKSLMLRIWVTFTIIILIIICCISFLYLVAFRIFDENSKIQDLAAAHNILVNNGNFEDPLRFDKLKNLVNIKNLIVNVNGTTTQTININAPNDQPDSLENKEGKWLTSFIKYVNNPQTQFKENYNNIEFLFIISPIESQTSEKAYFITYMPYSLDKTILYKAIFTGIIFIFIAFFTSKLVAGYISKPLKELEDYTKKIANKHWGEPIRIRSNDEIGNLANSMNIMQKKLKYAEENEKLFFQSISHDLKTPVMVIMSHAEAIIEGLYIDSIEKTAEIIKNEAIYLEKKIKQILYLNTLDYMLENNIENKDTNLQDILNKIIHRFKTFNNDIVWDLNIKESIIWGNREKVIISIENVLDNALRYAKTTIKITLKEENNFAVLEIYNDGNTIRNNDIDRIFDSMYKDKKGNFGLGLAISKKIINFYKGDIKAVNRSNGVSFIIKYPNLC